MHKFFTAALIPAIIIAGLQIAAAQDGLITKTEKSLTLRAELEAAQAAIDTCAAIKVPLHVFIVDANGNTQLFLVGDGARNNTVDSARRKAFAAVISGHSTLEIAKKLASTPGMSLPPDDRMLFVGGGVPIRAGEEVIGAIGVGGGAPEQDDSCAQAGVAKIQHYLQ